MRARFNILLLVSAVAAIFMTSASASPAATMDVAAAPMMTEAASSVSFADSTFAQDLKKHKNKHKEQQKKHEKFLSSKAHAHEKNTEKQVSKFHKKQKKSSKKAKSKSKKYCKKHPKDKQCK
ncbi:unnamed protein product [Mucor fragilis]